jgi:hypothetical protein
MVITREKFSAAKAKKQGAQNIPKVAEITFVNFLHF